MKPSSEQNGAYCAIDYKDVSYRHRKSNIALAFGKP